MGLMICMLLGVSTFIMRPDMQKEYSVLLQREPPDTQKLGDIDKFSVFNLFPVVPESMKYEEFRYLQIGITSEDKIWSLLIPGYIHFSTYDTPNGLFIMAIRAIGYGLIAYSAYTIVPSSLKELKPSNLRTKIAILGLGIGLNVGGWVYDVIHGEYRLREKQLSILFKYRKEFNINDSGR